MSATPDATAHNPHDSSGPVERRVAQRRQHDRRVKDRRITPSIEVTPEMHVLLQEKAERQGKTLDQYLRELIEREAEP
jgi:hypothetical protein